MAVVAVVALFLYLGLAAINDTKDEAQRERLTTTAQTVADHVDDVLTRTVGREVHLAQMVSNAQGQGDSQMISLLNSYPRFLFESELYLLRPPEDLVWSMNPAAPGSDVLFSEPLVTKSVELGHSILGACSGPLAEDRHQACFATPVRLEDGQSTVLLAHIDLSRPDLDLFSLNQIGESFRVELVTSEGLILAAKDMTAGEYSTYAGVIADLAAEEPVFVDTHDGSVDNGVGSHPLAYAPISLVPGWGVIVEPKDGAALAAADSDEDRLWLFAIVAIPSAFVLAWLGTRQLLKPLRTLAARGVQVASGDLTAPVDVAHGDEVGELAHALENLRISLKTALVDAERFYDAHRLGESRGRLLDGLMLRQEEERRRVAQGLHEEALQSLFALSLSLDSLEDSLSSAKQAPLDLLTRARNLALALTRDLRQLAGELRPSTLDIFGLAPALRSYAENRLSPAGIGVSFEISTVAVRPPPALEASLYRMAQEAIDNAAAHARASSVRITLRGDERLVTLTIEDNGEGFAPAELLADPSAVRGLGVLSMQERVALVGGTFSIESAPGKGTRVMAEVPLQPKGSTTAGGKQE